MDALDEKLKNYYELIKSQDAELAPDFNELITTSVHKKKKKKFSAYLKVAAVLVALILVTWYHRLDSPKNEKPFVSNMITESLLQEPEYIWNWDSPTRNLLAPIEF